MDIIVDTISKQRKSSDVVMMFKLNKKIFLGF